MFCTRCTKSGGRVAYLQEKNVQSAIFTFTNKNVKILYIIYFGKRGTPFGMMLHYVYIIPKQTMLACILLICAEVNVAINDKNKNVA